jgi:hypothetical protein
VATRPPIPTDYDPYRADITDCHCVLCREIAYAQSDVLDFRGQRHLAAAVALLRALQAGAHTRMTLAESAAEARVAKAARLAELEAAGADPGTIAAVQRGYSKAVL